MQSTPQHAGGVTVPVLLITIAFIALGSFASGIIATCEPFLVLGMMLLLGLPHGATDHGLFLALRKGKPAIKKINFYLAYVGAIAAYGLVWYFFPLVAFGIFILLSVYHFGQSNWVDLNHGNQWIARLHYLLWGTGILLTPILLHAEEAIAIVATMTDFTIAQPGKTGILMFIASGAILNLAVTIALWVSKKIDGRRFLLELISYTLLLGLFFTNSLLLGFTVYFVFWHSLNSVRDQLRFFRGHLSPEFRSQLFMEVAMTVVGALVFCLIIWFGPGPEAALNPSVIGGVFILISLLTMPHMLLVEQLYTNWSPRDEIISSPVGERTSTNQTISKPQSAAFPFGGEVGKITH